MHRCKNTLSHPLQCTNNFVYSTVQDDEVKRAYLLQSVYEPAMKFAPKKRKGVHKPGQNTTK